MQLHKVCTRTLTCTYLAFWCYCCLIVPTVAYDNVKRRYSTVPKNIEFRAKCPETKYQFCHLATLQT